jgi:hypothetical protein
MQDQAPSIFRPAVISGVAFGVAGAIPVLNWLNCACCALIIGCGFLAAYLLSQQHKAAGVAFLPGTGAQVGLVSGLVYGVVTSIASTILNAVLGLGDWQEVIRQMEEVGTMDPEMVEQINRFMETTGPTVLVLFGLFVSVLLGAIFATLGGLLGGSVFKYRPDHATDTPRDDGPPPPPLRPGG